MDADVIVVGAGAAGLAAARTLAGFSFRVIVLEARDRIGGRVWSRPIDGSPTSAELGAEFIHGSAHMTMALLQEANLQAVGISGQSWMCDEAGELVNDDDDFSESARSIEGARELAVDESAQQYLERLARDGTGAQVIEDARAFIEGFEAADPAIASARAIAEELHSGVDYRSSRPVGGYGPLFEVLRRSCERAGVELKLSAVVTRIRWNRGEVRIEVNGSSSEKRVLHARCAIVTLPLGVLKYGGSQDNTRFEPELPVVKRDALKKMEMGHVAKAVLAFRSPFWERISGGRYRDADFFRCGSHPFNAYWTQLPERSNLVVAWAGGPKASALLHADDWTIVDRAVESFGSLFKEQRLAREEFVAGAMHDWNSDPFARGAYSYVLVNGGDARRHLSAPVDDTLFFAGEATSTDGQGGTVNGALSTGERAAREAAASLGVKNER